MKLELREYYNDHPDEWKELTLGNQCHVIFNQHDEKFDKQTEANISNTKTFIDFTGRIMNVEAKIEEYNKRLEVIEEKYAVLKDMIESKGF